MKWNWGTKLAIFIILFLLFIMGLVFFSLRNDVLLVEKDYYPKGLVYQQRIDEMNNTAEACYTIRTEQDEQQLYLRLPDQIIDSGTLLFFRPSDNSLDINIRIDKDTDQNLTLDKNLFTKGKYLLKAHWYAQGKGYYLEKPIVIQ